MSLTVLTPDNIESYVVYIFNREAIPSVIFALLCIFVLLRYSSKAMNGGYRFHLLNITIFTLFCDLNITVLTRFVPLSPASGGCFIGELGVLTKWMDVEALAKLIVFTYTFILMVNISTMCNAAIHRYLFVSDFVGENRYKFSRIYVDIFMVFLQIIWPLIAAAFLMKIDFRPAEIIEENKRLYPEIHNRTLYFPCIYVVSGVDEFVSQYLLYGFCYGLHIVFCALVTAVLLVSCWYKILHVKQNINITKRTLKLERRLLVTLTIQSLFPCIVFVLATFTFLLQNFFEFFSFLTSWVNALFPMHSAANFVIVFCTIPVYYTGVFKDLQFLVTCGRYPKEESSSLIVSFATSSDKIIPLKVPFFKRVQR